MPSDDPRFQVKPLLDALRAETSDSEFGYRMQGMFAHVLGRIGCTVLEVNAQGHPDVKARMGERLLLAQVKAISHAHASTVFALGAADLGGIGSTVACDGYLAVLDCAVPVGWILVASGRAKRHVGRPVHIATLRAEQDQQLSDVCTTEFTEMMLAAGSRILNVPYTLLVRRALRGDYF